jgi:hypothetical protein
VAGIGSIVDLKKGLSRNYFLDSPFHFNKPVLYFLPYSGPKAVQAR